MSCRFTEVSVVPHISSWVLQGAVHARQAGLGA